MGIVSNGIASSGGTDVSDATAKAYDIKTGKTAYIASGVATGTGYFPALMQYPGVVATSPLTRSYYSKSITTSGNLFTCVLRFRCSPKAGTAGRYLFTIHTNTTNSRRLVISVQDSSHANAEKLEIYARNSSGTALLLAVSPSAVTDGENHTLFVAFNATAGTAVVRLDGVAITPSTLTTGTLNSGSQVCHIGDTSLLVGVDHIGSLGYVGYRDAYLTNWNDFMETDGTPKQLDETTWAEWSGGSVTSPQGRPLLWNENGDMVNNLGSVGAMTKNNTISVAAASAWS